MPDCRLQKRIDDLLVVEFYFLLGRMHVDIYLYRIEIDKQRIEWKAVPRDHLRKSTHDGMIQVRTPDESVVHKKILVPPRLLGRFGLADKSIHVQVVCILLHRDQFAVISAAEYLHDALFETSFLEMHDLLAIGRKRKKDRRERERHTRKLVYDMSCLRRVAL